MASVEISQVCQMSFRAHMCVTVRYLSPLFHSLVQYERLESIPEVGLVAEHGEGETTATLTGKIPVSETGNKPEPCLVSQWC